ncbi:hypothetical protein N7532_011334 [Penicillium argentinense]|uniref:Uncharacterized protein n=1 Tax=Penicillium argentinense TaxID=1131581 RepID=A0A9W9JUW7_9EURO|nr:uncharacterized protein N7532_011334 [Penicillium argentinense]KAJ5082291.1 hypothetical protein N7532_011334 [Penicillium argentinense]
MHHFISPFPSLSRRHRQTSDTSSPPSSRTTSPPASPTSLHRHFSQASPNHPFHLPFHPHNSNSKSDADSNHHDHDHDHVCTGRANSPSHPHCGVSILPCAVLRGRSSLMVLRRRPSAVDMALSEERSRCNGDAIERKGLDLMEPRPVDMELHAQRSLQPSSAPRASLGESREASVQQPRFVMGGIFEVMEGRA